MMHFKLSTEGIKCLGEEARTIIRDDPLRDAKSSKSVIEPGCDYVGGTTPQWVNADETGKVVYGD